MAMIKKNKEIAEEIVKLYSPHIKDKRFQTRYLKSILNLSTEELNILLGSIFVKNKGKYYYLKCRNDDLCVCEETIMTLETPRYTNKRISSIEFDLRNHMVFRALNTCNTNPKGVAVPRYIYVFEDLLEEKDEQRLQLGFFNLKYKTNLSDEDLNTLLSEANNEGYEIDYSFKDESLVFGIRPKELPKYIGLHERLTFVLRNID